MSRSELLRYGAKVAGSGFLLLGLLGCQEQKALTSVALGPVVTPEAASQAASECVLPNPPERTLQVNWQRWEKNTPLIFSLPDRSDIIFQRQSVQAKNRDGEFMTGVFVTIEKLGPPDWKKQIIKQGFLNPFGEYFLEIEGLPIIALYACDETGEEIYWANLPD